MLQTNMNMSKNASLKITQTHVQKKSPTQELLFSGEEKVAQINECKFRWIDGVSTS